MTILTETRNSKVERYYFEWFRKYYQIPDGEVRYSDKPDVVINGKVKIGVEISRIYIKQGGDPTSEQV